MPNAFLINAHSRGLVGDPVMQGLTPTTHDVYPLLYAYSMVVRVNKCLALKSVQILCWLNEYLVEALWSYYEHTNIPSTCKYHISCHTGNLPGNHVKVLI